jgi:hypothetical protein
MPVSLQLVAMDTHLVDNQLPAPLTMPAECTPTLQYTVTGDHLADAEFP